MKTFLNQLQLVPTAVAFLGSTKVKDRDGGAGEPMTLSLQNTQFSPAPGTLITIPLEELFQKGVSMYFKGSLPPFLHSSILRNLIECDRQATGLLWSFEQ